LRAGNKRLWSGRRAVVGAIGNQSRGGIGADLDSVVLWFTVRDRR
jgi:hypothetical protein